MNGKSKPAEITRETAPWAESAVDKGFFIGIYVKLAKAG